MKDLNCQKCGSKCVKTNDVYTGKSELGFSIPNIIYKCENCGLEHIICPECNGNKFKINYNSDSIFEEVFDCNVCQGMGGIENFKEIF